MKIVIAMDSFKGTLSAVEACEAVRAGVLDVSPAAVVRMMPMADGGEGTAEVLVAARSGAWVFETVMGPLPDRKVRAGFGWFADTREAVVEMAAASGLTLLRRGELNPLRTTTYGTGQLLAAAAAKGAGHIWLAVGGSATVDGGTGAASALGWRFLDGRGRPLPPGGGALCNLALIEPPPAPFGPKVEVLCDVDNPLCGAEGAARIFGPQKGATPEMVECLDRGLRRLADHIEHDVGKNVRELPGGGAAGGLAAGAAAFLDASLVSGIDAVMDACNLGGELKGADWVLSGEGRFDEQSLRGKVVSGITRRAREAGARVAVLAGSVEVSLADCKAAGIAVALPTAGPETSRDEAMARAGPLLRQAAMKFAREWL